LWGKVTFTKRPRETLDEIFDREREIGQIRELLERREWIALLGSRMSGKTSLAKAVSRSLNARIVYADLTRVKGLRDVYSRIYTSLPQDVTSRLRETLEFLQAGPVSVEFRKPTSSLENLLRSLCDRRTVLILDEVQDVKTGVNHLIPIFHRLMNSCPNVSLIFTGSSIGLMRTLLEQEGDQPLAGRNPVRIALNPWDRRTAEEYLGRGLSECGISYTNEEVEEVLDNLGTLVGWLNFYGVNRCVKSHQEALRESLEEAIGVSLSELRNVADTEWKRKALRDLAVGTTWNELLRVSRVSTETLSKFLNKLDRLYLLTKEGNTYLLQDPVYRRAVRAGLQ